MSRSLALLYCEARKRDMTLQLRRELTFSPDSKMPAKPLGNPAERKPPVGHQPPRPQPTGGALKPIDAATDTANALFRKFVK